MLMEWKCCSCRGGVAGSAGGCALSRRALRSGRRANIAVMAVFLAVSGWEVFSARPPYYEQFLAASTILWALILAEARSRAKSLRAPYFGSF